MSVEKIYGHDLPKINSYVNFIFTARNEHLLECRLIDYDIEAIMYYNLLTNKKKIKSINSLTPLNKPMIGMVDSIVDNIVVLNLINVDSDSEEYKKHITINSDIHYLKKILKQFSHKYKSNYDIILQTTIYPLDIVRIEKNSNLSLYQYIIDNIDIITDNILKEFIYTCYEVSTTDTDYKITTPFSFISTGGVEHTKEFFNIILKDTQYIKINLLTTPNYEIYSNHKDINSEHHKMIIQRIMELGKNYNPPILYRFN